MDTMYVFDFKSWIIFNVSIVIFILIDLKGSKVTSKLSLQKSSILWSFIWFALAIMFGIFIGMTQGKITSYEFFTVYLMEKSLSIDNLLVFAVIFQTFKLTPQMQQKALTIGVFSALVLRLLMILGGIELIHKFHFMIYVFGGLLMLTGIKLFFVSEEKHDFQQNYFLKKLNKFFDGSKNGSKRKLKLSSFVKVIILIEISDVIFAIDSIPAALAITTNSFVVYTANVFAILGLRALYHIVVSSMQQFAYFTRGLSIVLIMTSFKMLGIIRVKPEVSLLLTVAIILITIGLSLKRKKCL